MNDPKEKGIAHTHESIGNQKNYARTSHAYNMANHKNIYLKFDRFVTDEGIMIEKPIVPEKKKKKSKTSKTSKTKFKKIDV